MGRSRETAAMLGIAAAALVITLAGGCSSSAEKAATSPAVGAPNQPYSAGGLSQSAAPGGSSGGSSGAQAAAPSAAPSGPASAGAGTALANLKLSARSIVYTASLTVRVKDVQTAKDHAAQLAEGVGGFVGDEKTTSGTVPGVKGLTQSVITLRVPSDKFYDVLGQLGQDGTIEAQNQSASDVTDDVVDTTSRITSQEASIARITELMNHASALGDVVSLEGELSRRQADLDSLKSRLAALSDQVSLSSITVTYLVPVPPPAVAPITAQATAPVAQKHQNALQRGLHDGWVAFSGVVKVLLIVGGTLLPFAIVAAVLWWPARRFLLPRLRARTAPSAQRASGDLSSASAAAAAEGSK